MKSLMLLVVRHTNYPRSYQHLPTMLAATEKKTICFTFTSHRQISVLSRRALLIQQTSHLCPFLLLYFLTNFSPKRGLADGCNVAISAELLCFNFIFFF